MLQTQGAGSSSQTEKSTADRDSRIVRNLPIKVTSQRASSSGVSPHGASTSSKHMGELKASNLYKVGRFQLGEDQVVWKHQKEAQKPERNKATPGAYSSNRGVR
jgi:hypothetical protein